MKLYSGTRLAVFCIEGMQFDILGDPNTPDTRTALGWRNKYAPGEPIVFVWEERAG